jgi:hypothetical protein
MHNQRAFCLATLFCLSVLPAARLIQAAPHEFLVDQSRSSITLNGTVFGNKLSEQGPGSMITTFGGRILADVEPSGIQFTGGSVIDAVTNGVWQPGPGGASGSAPADYAARASTLLGSIKGSLRNLVLDLTSGVLPVSEGRFDASTLVFSFPDASNASFDYDAGFLGKDGIVLSGLSTNRIVDGATLVSNGDLQTLTIEIDTEFTFTAIVENDSTVHLTGTLVATGTKLPVITSVELDDQTLVIRVEGTGPAPALYSSHDLKTWTPRAADQTNDASGALLTLPLSGNQEFYRVAK